MKIKVLSALVLCTVALLCLPSGSVEAKTHFSFNIGSFFAPTPRVYERYVVEQPVYVTPGPYLVPQPVYVQPMPRRYYREVHVVPQPPIYSGFSFGWRR